MYLTEHPLLDFYFKHLDTCCTTVIYLTVLTLDMHETMKSVVAKAIKITCISVILSHVFGLVGCNKQSLFTRIRPGPLAILQLLIPMSLARRAFLASSRSRPILLAQRRAASSSSHDHHEDHHHQEDSTAYPAESECFLVVLYSTECS